MKTSLASVTFRAKSREEIVSLAVNAGLHAIEWGGDIHVPAGDECAARSALALCRAENLTVSAYGSYYSAKEDESFDEVLKTALILETRVIRIWAARCSGTALSPAQRGAIVNRLTAACLKADQVGCVLACEYHADTLTDTLQSTIELLNEIPLLKTLWQPPVARAHSQNLKEIALLRGKTENLHVYHRALNGDCRPLSEGADNWREYLSLSVPNSAERFATLEFVMGDSERQFLKDADTLHSLLKQCSD